MARITIFDFEIYVSHQYCNFQQKQRGGTVQPVCNDHLYNKIFYLWIQ